MKGDLEKSVEDYLVELVERAGGLCLKLKLIGVRGWPDRVILIKGRVLFVETKRPVGGRLSSGQTFWRRALRRVGFEVTILCEKEQVERFVNRSLTNC